jgi:leucyl-tRNA synthetase
MKNYDPKKIEAKIQKKWAKEKAFEADTESNKPKYYALMEFPYPSGDGLHTGHVRGYTAMDIIARKRRMEGFNVLYPIGWDAFGLPTENYAIKTGIQPSIITKKNTDIFRKQFKSLGMSFDWSREINTTDPKYYKWTQWLFLQFLKHDLAYKKKMAINWCPKDKIGLANEEVVNGCCERCGTPVEKREKEQWMLAITKYADRLDKDLDTLDYLPQIKLQQKNWIGKSEGAEIDFVVRQDLTTNIKVFTTRPDTIFGATYMVLAPEHELLEKIKLEISNWDEVLQYTVVAKSKAEIDRTSEGKDKTGVELKGLKAINPATKEEIPVWIADYVLPQYGTGAIMAVPSDDKRDNEFAIKYNLPIIENYTKAGFEDFGKKVTRFKLRDWVFSRQRYWGEPIPVIHCEKCGVVPVPEKDLPVELPKVKNYQPTDTGESPLASIDKWVNVKCPKCDGKAKRETDTMPNWAGSSWYFLRYTDPHNYKSFAGVDALKHWTPIDWYNGGMEHTTLHLLYSRFWHKFLFDLKLVPTSEPYKKRTSHGLVLAEGGEKMSKSKGNVINPDEIVKIYGADTLRVYEMFMGPFDQAIAWSSESIIGPRRFLEKVWRLQEKISTNNEFTLSTELETAINKTIKKVTEDIETMSFNTAISSLMILVNDFEKLKEIPLSAFKTLLVLLTPFTPHISEELWSIIGENNSISAENWPKYDSTKLVSDTVRIVVQVNGKVRSTLDISSQMEEKEVTDLALNNPNVKKWTEGGTAKKIIYVKNRLINIVL